MFALGLISCSGNKSATADASSTVKLQGAGASFPAPLYTRWFKSFGSSRPNVLVDYQSVGSGSGVKSVIDKTVDFGASDAAMSDEEISRVDGGVQLIPMTAGSIVIAYNLPDVKDLKLSRKAYSGIFLGKIKKWNDPEIAKANPDVKLPDTAVNVVVRADSSGTSYVFSKHLSAISPEFDKTVGTNKMPNWPVGTKSKGNEGVTASLMTTPGMPPSRTMRFEPAPMTAIGISADRLRRKYARSFSSSGMKNACARPPTRNQVNSPSDWLASRRPRNSGIFAFSSGTMSGKLIVPSIPLEERRPIA